jgi:hypothetical protein
VTERSERQRETSHGRPPASSQSPSAPEYRRRWIRGNRLHNLLVFSGGLDRLPAPGFVLLATALATLAGWLVGQGHPLAMVALGGAVVLDAIWLLVQPLLHLSRSPVNGPLFFFTLGRILVSLPLILLPSSAAAFGVLGIQTGLTILSVWGHAVAPFRIQVERVEAPVLRAASPSPLRIALLSDLHVERWSRREERVLEILDAEKPDLVLFAGDLLNLSCVDDAAAQTDARRFIREVRARYRLEVVLGTPTVEDRLIIGALYQDLGVVPVEGRCQRVTIRGVGLAILGLAAGLDPLRDAARLAEIVAATALDPYETPILLYHTPDLVGATPGIPLYLCGHTHGGQIRLPGIGPIFTASLAPRDLASGTHQMGRTLLHVSRGLGLEGLGAPRVRFRCPPEVTIVTLTKGDDLN